MHRSGTSALAGALQHAGLYAGEVVETATHNRRGNRENLEIRALNDDVLASSGGAWDDPPGELAWTDDQALRRDELVARFSRASPVWMFKDPRTVLTFGFWEQAGAQILPVGIFRHPARVVSSLATRSPMSTARGLRLWRLYNRIVLDRHRADPFPLLSFDSGPEGFAIQLRDAIELLRPAVGDRVQLSADAADEFYAPELVHASTVAPELISAAPEQERERVTRLLAETERLYASLTGRSLAR